MTTLDTDNVTYTVTGFDEKNLVVLVDFQGSSSAAIGLKDIPQTQAELDALVKPFAPHKEVVETLQAVAAASVDTSFIKASVGKTNTTTRFSRIDSDAAQAAVLAAQAANEAPLPEVSANEIVIGGNNVNTEAMAKAQLQEKAADVEYIKQLIQEVLSAQAAPTTTAS